MEKVWNATEAESLKREENTPKVQSVNEAQGCLGEEKFKFWQGLIAY